MSNYVYFKTKTDYLYNVDSKNDIFSDDLLDLIKDTELKELIINKYDLDKNILINIDKADIVYNQIKSYVDRFELLRLTVPENKVDTFLKENPEEKKYDYYFNIKEACIDENTGEMIENLEAVAIYDSLDLFYKDRSLSQYVKSLNKSKNLNKSQLLDDLNISWKRHFDKYPKDVKPKIFRVLKNKDLYYVKSINSKQYKEYGIAESFVLSMLELNKIHLREEVNFTISSISLRESKIDMIISLDKKVSIKDVGYFRPSISIRNEDTGNASLGVHTSIEFYPENNEDNNKIYLFPKKDKDNNKIENKTTANHTINQDTLLELFESISDLFDYLKQVEKDFKFYNDAQHPDELRQKIAEKVCNTKGMFKGLTKLQGLFERKKDQQITNLQNLLEMCGKAEMLDMDFDLKFKLRYLISNVLLYGNNTIK
ncbi:hypothetical protein [Myroides odoratimimus]|uniref:hypothetical protein n=1 Tax=Myroides odoratimimus TaxID=76832 RepID=UPI002DBCE847|nr:hypothetical protein [Myroides odoratimimus]MEC4084657.1 hypothetical protein [Myroides odoratimimus]